MSLIKVAIADDHKIFQKGVILSLGLTQILILSRKRKMVMT